MGILGLTHDEDGAALEKLPVTIKVAIGEGPTPDDENGSPRALFHFVFKRRTMREQMVYWEPTPDIAQVFGDKLFSGALVDSLNFCARNHTTRAVCDLPAIRPVVCARVETPNALITRKSDTGINKSAFRKSIVSIWRGMNT